MTYKVRASVPPCLPFFLSPSSSVLNPSMVILSYLFILPQQTIRYNLTFFPSLMPIRIKTNPLSPIVFGPIPSYFSSPPPPPPSFLPYFISILPSFLPSFIFFHLPSSYKKGARRRTAAAASMDCRLSTPLCRRMSRCPTMLSTSATSRTSGTETSLLTDYFVLGYIPADWLFRTGIYSYCLTILYWNIFLLTEYFGLEYIPTGWLFCTEISLLTDYFVLKHP